MTSAVSPVLRTLFGRFQRHEHVGASCCAAAAPAQKSHHVLNAGVLRHERRKGLHVLLDYKEGRVLLADESVPPMRPVSCWGKKPLGMITNRYMFSAMVSRKTIIVSTR